MLAGIVLFIFGTSSVKGFATMLILSILTSFITAVFLSRFLLGLLVESRWLDRKKAGLGCAKDILDIRKTDENTEPPNPFSKWDFVGKRKWFFAFSGVLLAAGLIVLLVFKLNLGIDFSSGSRIEVQSDHKLTTQQLERTLNKSGLILTRSFFQAKK